MSLATLFVVGLPVHFISLAMAAVRTGLLTSRGKGVDWFIDIVAPTRTMQSIDSEVGIDSEGSFDEKGVVDEFCGDVTFWAETWELSPGDSCVACLKFGGKDAVRGRAWCSRSCLASKKSRNVFLTRAHSAIVGSSQAGTALESEDDACPS